MIQVKKPIEKVSLGVLTLHYIHAHDFNWMDGRSAGTYIELDVSIVGIALVVLPVVGRDGEELPFSVVHELPLIVSDGVSIPPQSQVYFLH